MTMAVLTACSSDSDDSPSQIVDDKEWKADANKDASVGPGDEFYMYCNGGYRNNTKVALNCKLTVMSLKRASFHQVIQNIPLTTS